MSSEVRPQSPDVVEHGTYSEQGEGPDADTTVYASEIPHGRVSPGPSDRRISMTSRFISRDRLARRDPVVHAPAPEARPGRKVPTMGLLVAAFVGLCLAGIGLAVSLARPEPAPPVPEVREADLPDEIDGVPVRRGLRRQTDATDAD